MSLPNAKKYEKKLDLGNNLAIYEAHQDALREQEKNAQVMSPDKFSRLVENIAGDKRLESLPLCVMKKSQDGESAEFHIISGHHRLRAARKAGISEVFILVDESPLTEDQIKSKQLSHNSLVGQSDAQLLKELFDSIETIDNKIMSGITSDDFDMVKNLKSSIEEIKIDINYEFISIAFLPTDFEKWNEIMPMLQKKEENKNFAANIELFPQFKDQVREVFERENIRSISSALVKMLDIVKEYYENKPIINNDGEQENGEQTKTEVEKESEEVELPEEIDESEETGAEDKPADERGSDDTVA